MVSPTERAEEVAAAMADGAYLRDIDTPLTLSTGVVLKFRPVPAGALRRFAIQYPEPEIPVQFVESKGRDEPNPMHPDYLKAIGERNEALLMGYFNLALLISAQVVSVPEGFPTFEDESWAEELDAAGIIVPTENASRRRLSWLKLYAAPLASDLAAMSAFAMARGGLAESEVSKAAASFLSEPEWAGDHGASPEQRPADGDQF